MNKNVTRLKTRMKRNAAALKKLVLSFYRIELEMNEDYVIDRILHQESNR